MLDRTEKEKIVINLRADLNRAEAVFVTDMIGIPANEAVSIRKEMREACGKIVVAKNTLFKKAAEGGACEKLFLGLEGSNAMAFAFGDASAVAKCLKKAGEDFETVSYKGGLWNGEEMTVDQMKSLASLPPREQMMGTVLATMMAPVSSFVRILNTIKEKKEQIQTESSQEKGNSDEHNK